LRIPNKGKTTEIEEQDDKEDGSGEEETGKTEGQGDKKSGGNDE